MYKISYIADGARTEFAFAFPFFQSADVRVALNDVVSAADHNYAVVPNADFTGGNVVFDIAPPAETKIDIFRQISLSRTIDYQPTRRIDPEDLNTDFKFWKTVVPYKNYSSRIRVHAGFISTYKSKNVRGKIHLLV